MQGQRSTVESFPETFELDHGSSSSGTGVDQQLSWNTMLNPIESRIPDCLLSPHDTSFTFPTAVGHDGRSLSGWCLGEGSSSENTGNQIVHDEAKVEHAWPPSLNGCAGSGPRLEERQYESSNILSLENVNLNLSSNQVTNGPLFLQNLSSAIPQNMNLDEGYSGNNGARVMEAGVCSRLRKPGGPENEHILYSGNSSGSSSGAGYLAEESDGRPGSSLDGRRLACKRKALEGVSGQLSLGGSPSCFQRAENSASQSVPTSYNVACSSSFTTSSENPPQQPNPRLGVDISLGSSSHPAFSAVGSTESSQRNFRMRINPAHLDSPPSNISSIRNISRPSHTSPYQSSRLLSFNHSLELRPTTGSNSTPSPSHAIQNPGMSRNVHPATRYGASNSRAGSSSSSPSIPGERSASREESNIRNIPWSISEHPMFIPSAETRNLFQDPTNWSLANGNTRIPRTVASTSRVGSSSGVHPSAAPTWLPLQNPPAQPSRRLSEAVRRPLFPSPGSDAGGQGHNVHSLHSGVPSSAQEIVHPSGAGHLGHHQPYHRSALRMDRQGDGVVGVPLSARGLAVREGRSRLVSEIRSALDFMRRGGGGEGVRFEDVFVLDQSIFYGMSDLHDRHRDMRLDVDNMSYEELLALEDRIGNVSTGLSEETITKCLKQRKYMSFTIGVASEIEPCCVCQEEYIDGDDLGRLDCGHDFHSECIKQWLTHKNLCPICKTTALVT
ncbi:E3 ubiquitin-protein ligase mbr2-like [Thalictrum thalictroides]|uniref:RING-type E3 ubiquitin transferase n=1 Tax=Thalictrum thalictroides TaxID=46969 RepID=A0A7J6WQ52_THATH|nr:E3 ubiquitin-protein ligase mbr2-like [Thalictrum thalictroides]